MPLQGLWVEKNPASTDDFKSSYTFACAMQLRSDSAFISNQNLPKGRALCFLHYEMAMTQTKEIAKK